jgi:hypothetical protein
MQLKMQLVRGARSIHHFPRARSGDAMACQHHENDDIAKEKLQLKSLSPPKNARVGATTITLWKDGSEKNQDVKLDALEGALKLVRQRTGKSLDGLRVYLGAPCRCIAFLGERAGSRSHSIFLGDQMLHKTVKSQTERATGVKGGVALQGLRAVADQEYDAKRKSPLNPARWVMGEADYKASKVKAKAIAVIVHEFGHLLHEEKASAKYWQYKRQFGEEGKSDAPPADIAVQVSHYATKHMLEFTAEVFTGLIYDRHYGPEVMALYKKAGGVAVT